MNRQQKKKRRRREAALQSAYSRANSKPRERQVRVRSMMPGMNTRSIMPQSQATEWRRTRRALLWKRRVLEEAENAANEEITEDSQETPTETTPDSQTG